MNTPTPTQTDEINSIVSDLSQNGLFKSLDGSTLSVLAQSVEKKSLSAGDVLFDQNERSQSIYLIKKGLIHLVPSKAQAADIIKVRQRGDVVDIRSFSGEMKYIFTALAIEETDLYQIKRTDWDQILIKSPAECQKILSKVTDILDQERLHDAMVHSTSLGSLSSEIRHELEQVMELRMIPHGADLFRKGGESDYLYLVVNGRFSILGHEETFIAELNRGDVFGEIGVILNENRNASIRAVRDSMVALLDRDSYMRLLKRYPAEINHVTTAIIREHLIKSSHRVKSSRPKTLAILSGTPGLDPRPFTEMLKNALNRSGKTIVCDTEQMRQISGIDNIQDIDDDHINNTSVVNLLNELEFDCDSLFLISDHDDTCWKHRCLRHADKVLILVDPAKDHKPGPIEDLLSNTSAYKEVKPHLVLLHQSTITAPERTIDWLRRQDWEMHHHLRQGNMDDIKRVTRFLNGQAVGLVLGGGGARGFAHVGVLKAFEELDIPIDIIGGTSMGSIIAAQYALHWSPDKILEETQKIALAGDNLTLPIVSLFSGRKSYRNAQKMLGDVLVEDLWRGFFSISCNLSRAGMFIHDTGPLLDAVLASNAAPGLFPPFCHEKGLLVDGAFLNNVPVDVMTDMNPSGSVIAIDVNLKDDLLSSTTYTDGLSGWKVLLSRINPFTPTLEVPNIAEMLLRVSSIGGLAQNERSRESDADLYIQPPVKEFSLMDVKKAKQIAQVGYDYALPLLKKWQEDQQKDQS